MPFIEWYAKFAAVQQRGAGAKLGRSEALPQGTVDWSAASGIFGNSVKDAARPES